MKVIIFLFFILISCKKEAKQDCYKCTVYYTNGTRENKFYCGSDSGHRKFIDSQGNDLQTVCTHQ